MLRLSDLSRFWVPLPSLNGGSTRSMSTSIRGELWVLDWSGDDGGGLKVSASKWNETGLDEPCSGV